MNVVMMRPGEICQSTSDAPLQPAIFNMISILQFKCWYSMISTGGTTYSATLQMTLGHIEAFQINAAYNTKLILALRHTKKSDGWIRLDKL